ncbi:MAG TPA: FecR domain-containing protein [Steroidobacter sp.]|uniref:FecR family protein n=1 Tax=Steroidobacter sp. TaxID=1978227 RepID=UPI002ED90A5C
MKDDSGVLIGVCRPVPDALGFVTPVFRDRTGEPVAQIVEDGRIVRFVQLDLGEEFVPLKSLASVSVGDPALYGMEFDDCIAVGSPISAMTRGPGNVADWSDVDAIKAALESNRYKKSSELLTFPRPRTNKRNLFSLAACAAGLVFALTAVFGVQHYLKSPQVVTTGASEWDHRTLRDGSSIHVDARSNIKIEYSDAARLVHLRAGGAVFEVTKDANRPFIVRTHLVDIIAVGTRFGVAIDGGVTTTVSDGTVKVAGRGHVNGSAVLVEAGEELRVPDSSLALPSVAPVDAKNKLQWTSGWLDLTGATVAQSVAQFNRRNRVQLVVDSPTLSAKVIEYARVKVDQPMDFAAVIAQEPGVKMTFDTKNDVIRLSD